MVLQEQEKHCLLELLLIIPIAPLSEYQALNWFKNTLERVLEWYVSSS